MSDEEREAAVILAASAATMSLDSVRDRLDQFQIALAAMGGSTYGFNWVPENYYRQFPEARLVEPGESPDVYYPPRVAIEFSCPALDLPAVPAGFIELMKEEDARHAGRLCKQKECAARVGLPWKPDDIVPVVDVLRFASDRKMSIEVNTESPYRDEQFISYRGPGASYRMSIYVKSFARWKMSDGRRIPVAGLDAAIACIKRGRKGPVDYSRMLAKHRRSISAIHRDLKLRNGLKKLRIRPKMETPSAPQWKRSGG